MVSGRTEKNMTVSLSNKPLEAMKISKKTNKRAAKKRLWQMLGLEEMNRKREVVLL